MTSIRLKYVHRFRDRHGVQRFYLRRPGAKKVALPGLPGSPEFMAAYHAAVTQAVKKEAPAVRAPDGTVDALAASWYKTTGFQRHSQATKDAYRRNLERLRSKHGHRLVADLEPRRVRSLLEAMGSTPAMANQLLRVLRSLMKHAVELGWRDDDPTLGVRRLKEKAQGTRTWSEQDIATFEARWPIGSKPRLALALLLYTGQRRSDVIRMAHSHVRKGAIFVRQQKTRAELLIPLHPQLQANLALVPSEQATFVVMHNGAPFGTGGGFYKWFMQCCREAGLEGNISPHGLRKAAARRLAEAGCTPHQIAAISGHRSLGEIVRYTNAANQQKLAEDAMAMVIRYYDHKNG